MFAFVRWVGGSQVLSGLGAAVIWRLFDCWTIFKLSKLEQVAGDVMAFVVLTFIVAYFLK